MEFEPQQTKQTSISVTSRVEWHFKVTEIYVMFDVYSVTSCCRVTAPCRWEWGVRQFVLIKTTWLPQLLVDATIHGRIVQKTAISPTEKRGLDHCPPASSTPPWKTKTIHRTSIHRKASKTSHPSDTRRSHKPTAAIGRKSNLSNIDDHATYRMQVEMRPIPMQTKSQRHCLLPQNGLQQTGIQQMHRSRHSCRPNIFTDAARIGLLCGAGSM